MKKSLFLSFLSCFVSLHISVVQAEDSSYTLPQSFYESQDSVPSSANSAQNQEEEKLPPSPTETALPPVAEEEVTTPTITPEPEPAPALVTSGYDGGFFIKDRDGKFSLGINGRMQFRYSYAMVEDVEDKHSFLMRRAFLYFNGHVFDPNLTWDLIIYPLAAPAFVYGTINYKFMDELKVSMGLDTVMYSHLNHESSGKLQILAKALPVLRYHLGDSMGIWLTGDIGRFFYATGVFNGNDTFTSQNANQELLYALRVGYNVFGNWSGGEGDLKNTESPAMMIETAAAFHHEETDTQAKVLNGTVYAGFKYRGFSLNTQGFYRYTDPDQFTREQVDLGYVVSAGYFFIPERFEIAARHSALLDDINDVGVNLNMRSGNISALGGDWSGVDVDGDSDNEYEYSLGLNYYFHKYNVVLQGQYSFIMDGIPGADDRVSHIGMMQMQVGF